MSERSSRINFLGSVDLAGPAWASDTVLWLVEDREERAGSKCAMRVLRRMEPLLEGRERGALRYRLGTFPSTASDGRDDERTFVVADWLIRDWAAAVMPAIGWQRASEEVSRLQPVTDLGSMRSALRKARRASGVGRLGPWMIRPDDPWALAIAGLHFEVDMPEPKQGFLRAWHPDLALQFWSEDMAQVMLRIGGQAWRHAYRARAAESVTRLIDRMVTL